MQPKKRGGKRKVLAVPDEAESESDSGSEIVGDDASDAEQMSNDAPNELNRNGRTASSIFKDIAAGGVVPQKRARKPPPRKR